MKRQFLLLAVIFSLTAAPFTGVLGNNLTITNISYGVSTVTFDLSWENSWHNSASANHNWDAAWIFVKFRDCASGSVSFTHGLISTTLADHNFNVSGPTTYEPAKSDGNVGIDASPDNTGILLRNAVDPFSGNNSATVTLKVTNLPSSGTLDLNVFGIEMVFVPQGKYSLGDASPYNPYQSSYEFALYDQNACLTPSNQCLYPFLISSENAQNVRENNANYCSNSPYSSPNNNTCGLSSGFQKGYNSFYMMKYEISQGQYANFLNNINQVARLVHFTYNYNNKRHTLHYVSPQYVADRPDRACNWLSWSDLTAYLDWAALRPLSEMEYEKAARGPYSPSPYYEQAWGGGSPTGYYAYQISGTEDGTETITQGYSQYFGIYFNNRANICAGGPTYTGGGDGGQEPLRCGIFATSSTTTRAQTGSGFYGAMELSGNINEYYVSVRAGDTFYSGAPSLNGLKYGDGNLDATGNQDVVSWPSYQSPQQYIIKRGGGWEDGINSCFISNRDWGYDPSRQHESGGRGGR